MVDSKESSVTVVALDAYSWKELLQNKFYAFPMKSRKISDYFAFYQSKPISAITHYARVQSCEEGNKEDVGILYWLKCMPNAEPPFQIVKFNEIKKLRSSIVKDNYSIQGKAYTTLGKLFSARNISDIFKANRSKKLKVISVKK
jgi:hypothetical protein